jgi:hypothetical protein
LAIADVWLSRFSPADVIEVGAVTPYYWPHRVTNVVDPFDQHPLVMQRLSVLEIDLNRPILSISTFEHIGMGDYGSTESSDAVDRAFEKLFTEAPEFLVTVPVGYNKRVDAILFEQSLPSDLLLDFVVRTHKGHWITTRDSREARQPYGDVKLQAKFPGTSIGTWANSVAVLERRRDIGG